MRRCRSRNRIVDRYARRPDPARCGGGQGDLLREAGRLALDRARTCAEAVARAGSPCLIGFQRRYDPTFAALKARIVQGEIRRSGNARRDEPRSRRATRRLRQALGRHLQGHADSRLRYLRWILDDEAATLYATGSCLTDPAIGAAATSTRPQ